MHFFSRKAFPNQCILCLRYETGHIRICHLCQQYLDWRGTRCVICAHPISTIHVTTCPSCQTHPPCFTSTTTAFTYTHPADILIRGLKYHNKQDFALPLSWMLAKKITQQARSCVQLLMPMPMHRTRFLQRGFNQARIVTKYLGKKLSLPVTNTTLFKIKHTRPQTCCTREKRVKNQKNVFAVRKNVRNLNIAIVDDVMTTTSTANEASKVLLREGAAKVHIWILARALA